MDISDLIYFLFVILGIVGSIFNQRKKTKSKPQPADQTDEKTTGSPLQTVLEDLVKEFTGQETPEEPSYKEEPLVTVTSESTTEAAPNKRVNYEPIFQSLEDEEKTLLEEEEIEHPILEDFTINKAIIYSEILKRPEY